MIEARASVIVSAAQLLSEREPTHDVILQPKEPFGLIALEVTKACALASRYRSYRRAHS